MPASRSYALGFCTDREGRQDFRQLLPPGKQQWGNAAADGQMGQIMKLYMDWRLTLLSVGVLPVFALLGARVGSAARDLRGTVQTQMATLNATMQETLSVSGVLLTNVLNGISETGDHVSRVIRRSIVNDDHFIRRMRLVEDALDRLRDEPGWLAAGPAPAPEGQAALTQYRTHFRQQRPTV